MKSDIDKLLQKATDSIGAAELMLKEGYSDFAASRAYYALFYVAQALLMEKGLSFSSHAGVIGGYGREFAKTGQLDPKFHRYLIRAQETRNVADYSHHKPIPPKEARLLIQWAEEFLEAAQAFLNQR